jgi:CHASE2 domain-containing sensor protein
MKQFSTRKKQVRHFHFFGLYLGVALCLFVWSLSISGLLNTPSSLVYDFFVRITPKQTMASEEILLVEADYRSRFEGDETWVRLLDTLNNKGAKQIVFFFFPENVSNNFYQTAADLGYVIFGQELKEQSTHKQGTNRLRPLPPQTAGIKLRVGVLPPPLIAYGIHRDCQASIALGKQSLSHVTLLAAQERTGERYNPSNPFRIDFVGQNRSLPKISLSRVISGDIIQELIKDKTVLVGFTPPFPFKGFSTPVTPDSASMSPLEYHGLALQTLLDHTELRFPYPWEILAYLFLLIGLALIVHQTFGSFIHFIMVVLLFLVAPVACWLFLVFTKTWFPIVEILLAFSLFLLFIVARDRLLRNRLAWQILLDQSLKKQEKVMPKSFFRSEDYWPLVINMIKQTLNIRRTIFLETVEGDHRVSEVIALNISLEEIQERRRDYHRTPYKTAIEKNTAIQVNSYFKSLGDNEQSYLVPLNFFGQVQGFWAFTIDTEAKSQTVDILNTANILAREIGEMLFRRKQWIEEGRWRNNPLRKLLNMEKHHEPYYEVTRITAFLVRRLSVLESVFNALETGTILYTTFGMVIQSNRRMTQLSKSLNINAYGMSALDFGVNLTGKSSKKMRQILGRVIVNRETVQLSITIMGDKKQNMMLTIRPLIASDDMVVDKNESQPVEMNGFLFEIIDMPSLSISSHNQKQLYKHNLKHLREKLRSFSENMKILFNTRQNDNEEENCRRLKQKYDAVMHSIQSFEKRVHQELLAENPDISPVDLLEIFKSTIDNVQPDAQKRNVHISIQSADNIPLIQADPKGITELLGAIISLLIADALDDSTIIISANLQQDEIMCSLVNVGVGMPPETFQRFLASPDKADRDEFQKIHRILPHLQRWQATFSGTSDFGQGLSFKLLLMSMNKSA